LQFTTENHRSEFRTPDESVLLEYAALTSGRPHYIYPQHELVQRLCEALTAAGGQIRFGHAVRAVTQDSTYSSPACAMGKNHPPPCPEAFPMG
jgi:p-hydroxybenzoate 3-monooxygenase